MSLRVALVAATLMIATPAHAHWLDQYLQATTILVSAHRVQVQLRLTPGIAIYPRINREFDTNADGVISTAEQRAYAERVVRDISLRIDGTDTPVTLSSVTFSSAAEMKDGRGVISIDCGAPIPTGGANRQLTFENRHQRAIAVYLVNALVPTDPEIQVIGQHRNYEQSRFTLDYTQGAAGGSHAPTTWSAFTALWWIVAAFVLSTSLAVFWRRRIAVTASSPAT